MVKKKAWMFRKGCGVGQLDAPEKALAISGVG